MCTVRDSNSKGAIKLDAVFVNGMKPFLCIYLISVYHEVSFCASLYPFTDTSGQSLQLQTYRLVCAVVLYRMFYSYYILYDSCT